MRLKENHLVTPELREIYKASQMAGMMATSMLNGAIIEGLNEYITKEYKKVEEYVTFAEFLICVHNYSKLRIDFMFGMKEGEQACISQIVPEEFLL